MLWYDHDQKDLRQPYHLVLILVQSSKHQLDILPSKTIISCFHQNFVFTDEE